VQDVREREIRDLPWSVYRATVVQQTVRRDCGRSVRECDRQSGGAALPLTGDHGARYRYTLPGAVVWAGSKEGDAGRVFQNSGQRKKIAAACVDMWEPFRLSIEQWAPQCSIVYDKFHIIQHANDAVDEVRRAEFFRKGSKMRDLIKGKKWLLLSRWKNLEPKQRGVLKRLFQLNRRVFKAYLLKESLERLWDYCYEGAMLNYLKKWIEQLRWQRLPSFQKFAETLLKHLDGILNYCRTKVRFGVVEAINGNIRMLINRGRGYKNMRYLLLKAKRMAVTNTQYAAFQTRRKAA
jgi:transposase